MYQDIFYREYAFYFPGMEFIPGLDPVQAEFLFDQDHKHQKVETIAVAGYLAAFFSQCIIYHYRSYTPGIGIKSSQMV